MAIKIVSDSSSNLFTLSDVRYATVPLKIITDRGEYVDTAALDVSGMMQDLKTVKTRTQTSCPNPFEWREAFGEEDDVFAVAITGNLSGSCSAARRAAADALAEHPSRKIAVIDSLSTGPEMQLLIEKLREGILAGHSFEQIYDDVTAYATHTHLLFSLQSLANLARNGRVNPVVAKVAGLLGIRVVGVASEAGTLELLHKPRGREKTLDTVWNEMKRRGYCGGKVRIAHCENEEKAGALSCRILDEFPGADIMVIPTTALCSYYAELGGLMVGFEDVQ